MLKKVFLALLLLGVGFLLGTIQSRRENRLIREDLKWAIQRGVMLETNLILCKEKR